MGKRSKVRFKKFVFGTSFLNVIDEQKFACYNQKQGGVFVIKVKKATLKEKEEVYEWVCKSQEAEEKRYFGANLNIFFRSSLNLSQEMIDETLKKAKYMNRYSYYLAYEEEEIVGILSFVHIFRTDRNYLRIIDLYVSKNKKNIYDALLDTLEEYAKEENVSVIKMRFLFPQEKVLKECLENRSFELRKISLTDEDLKVEKKFKPLGYRISFVNKKEIKEVQSYYDSLSSEKKEFLTLDVKEYLKSESSRVLIARKNAKIIGVLFGSIVSPRYTVSYLDICVGDNEKIEHDLLNEFKRVCLKEESDDILVETSNVDFQKFILSENFKESRRSYWKNMKKQDC